MSPAPATATARRTAATSRRTVTRSPAPRAPRRVSGPARPARPFAVPRPAGHPGLSPRLGAWVRSLPDHRLLDRLIRGRTWIVLIGVLLTGIVFMQVSMLRMNAGISRAVEQSQTLQRQNQQLQASVAALGSDSRLRALAEREGFYTPTAGSERYLTAASADATLAARTMRAPKPQVATTPPAAQVASSTPPPASTTTTSTASTTAAAGTTPSGTTTTTPTTTTTAQTTTTSATAGTTTGTSIAAPPTQTTSSTGTTGSTGGAGAGG